MKKYLIPKLYLVKFTLLFFISFIFLSFSEPNKGFKFVIFKGLDISIFSGNSGVEENYEGNKYYCTIDIDSLLTPRHSGLTLELQNLTADTIIYKTSRNTGGHFITIGSSCEKVAPMKKFVILYQCDFHSIAGYFGKTVSTCFDNVQKKREDVSDYDYEIFLRIQGFVNPNEK